MHLKYLYYLGVLILLTGFILLRPINYDEAFFLMSAQRICVGEIPYTDFLFNQTPLLIYVYAVMSHPEFVNLILGRCLSVIFFITSFLILKKLLRVCGYDNQTLLFSFLFFLNTLLLNWVVIIKIYALSILLLTSGFYFFKRFIDKPQLSYLILSSLLFSFLVLTKIVFAVNLLLFVIFITVFTYRNDKKTVFRYTSVMLVSAAVPFILFFLIMRYDFKLLYFNLFELNFKINSIYNPDISQSVFYAVFKYLLTFLLPQNLILILIVLFSGFKYTFFEKFIAANIVLFYVIHFASLLLPEYMVSIMPLLILLAVLRYNKFVLNIIRLRKNVLPKNIITAIVLLYIIASPFSIEHLKYLIEHRPLVLNPVQMYGFEKRINDINGTRILSSWDGYSIFSNKTFLFTNDYITYLFRDLIDEGEYKKTYLRKPADYELMIRSKEADVIVYDRNNPLSLTGQEDLIAQNYKVAFEYKYIVVYRKM